MVNINSIKTSNWQLSTRGLGMIEQGANDINQCIANIFNTQKGSDPLRQAFGIDLLEWIDRPVNESGPGLAKEMIEQIAAYEQRIDLTQITYSTPDERVIFGLRWVYKPEDTPQGFSLIKNGTTPVQVYFLLTNESGFILLDDSNTSLVLN